jgi:hypothetical protein
MIKMQLDPKHRREATRSNDLAMRNLETIPQAYQEMQKLYHKLEEPYQNMQAEQADSFNANLRSSDQPSNIQKLTSEPLPNPWAPSPTSAAAPAARNTGLSRINMPFNSFNGSSSNTNSNNNSTSSSNNNNNNTFNQLQQGFQAFYNNNLFNGTSPRSSYQNQLDRMSEMGFSNSLKNLEALTACNGDLDLAITYLVEHGLVDQNEKDPSNE